LDLLIPLLQSFHLSSYEKHSRREAIAGMSGVNLPLRGELVSIHKWWILVWGKAAAFLATGGVVVYVEDC
jgi:hypothetical protein